MCVVQFVSITSRLPRSQDYPRGGEYEEFDTLYGSQTNESYCPSLAEAEHKCHGMPFPPSAQYARSTGLVIQCDECGKWRLLYSRKKTAKAQRDELQEIIEMLTYSCGSRLQDIQDTSAEVDQENFAKANLSCTSPIEVPYYSSNYELYICYHCGAESDRVPKITPNFIQFVNGAKIATKLICHEGRRRLDKPNNQLH